MKKFAAFAAVLTVMLLIGMTAMAAPLENPNLDVTQIDAFANWSNGEAPGQNDNGWVFSGSSSGAFNNGLVVLESADPDTAFTGRINLAEKISAEDMSKVTGVAFTLKTIPMKRPASASSASIWHRRNTPRKTVKPVLPLTS